jgi:hypothetical protein
MILLRHAPRHHANRLKPSGSRRITVLVRRDRRRRSVILPEVLPQRGYLGL